MKKILDTDIHGNMLIYKEYKLEEHTRRRTLSIKLKWQTREIAEVCGTSGNYYLLIKRKRAKHLMRKNNSYGFNDIMLKKSIDKGINNVHLVDEIGTYKFPISLILDKGDYLFFSQQGFERQLFLKLNIIEDYGS